ncbi:hypothetical protein CEXT_284231 [Caerostris extrusa]|uniref:Uncharacterized protein n=1 Tax=Caerostris extrusa TaxID=172846 RepID=A0AAV4XKJ1_CAEEX|nr:hypothetical protein CEXT_284231 [Caerostris extrusa]
MRRKSKQTEDFRQRHQSKTPSYNQASLKNENVTYKNKTGHGIAPNLNCVNPLRSLGLRTQFDNRYLTMMNFALVEKHHRGISTPVEELENRHGHD